MTTWRATETKAKFSAVLNKAKKEGPQVVRRRDEEFIVATRVEFQNLMAREVEADLDRSEEHTSELQSHQYHVCRLLLEKKKKKKQTSHELTTDTSSNKETGTTSRT